MILSSHANIHTQTHTFTDTQTYTLKHTFTDTQTYTHTHSQTHKHTHTHIHTNIHTHTFTDTQTYTHTHSQTHKHTHTHIHDTQTHPPPPPHTHSQICRKSPRYFIVFVQWCTNWKFFKTRIWKLHYFRLTKMSNHFLIFLFMEIGNPLKGRKFQRWQCPIYNVTFETFIW